MVRKLFVISFIYVAFAFGMYAQSALQPPDIQVYHWLDRLDIKYNYSGEYFSAIKARARQEIIEIIAHLDSSEAIISVGDRTNIKWLAKTNNHWLTTDVGENRNYTDTSQTFYSIDSPSQQNKLLQKQYSKKPLLRHFYKTPAHLFEVDKKDFFLRINPLFQFRLASVNQDNKLLFENQRGVSIHGGIDEKIYFHTEILESQARYPDYVNTYQRNFGALPGAGLVKSYRSRIFDFDNGVDYLLANAYIGINISQHVALELGHGRHFLGNGIRSLFLSDFATNYFYLKLNTKIWKFQYQNIFGELTRPERVQGLGDQLLPKKYFAAHYLGLNLSPSFSVGLFETVVFARENQFELQYLNPVILYRTVEGAIGSPDNVLLGIDIKWNLFRKASFYSQFVLDEFKISEITSGNGWWANKYGLQLGLKYLDIFGIDQLDTQIEYNVVRPYTFSHNSGVANYSHYNQGLAHPLGANFREFLWQLTYQPSPKWSLVARWISFGIGEDSDSTNWGGNILLPSETHRADFGNEIGQGTYNIVNVLGLDVSYEWRHGLFVDVFFQSRNKRSDLDRFKNNTNYVGAGLRWNLGRRWFEF